MNYFTEQSIQLANQRNYLDLLFKVYPLQPDSIREIDKEIWARIEKNYNNNDNIKLIEALLDLKLFPIKDGYIPYLRRDRSAIYRNPDTVNRICGRIKEVGLDELYNRCIQPKETNRQMGPLFKRWVDSGVLGLPVIDIERFTSGSENAILKGSDTLLQEYARNYLGYTRDKGIDFLARYNNIYIIGEAKFISDEGGHQNDQFLDAMATLETKTEENVRTVAILDGVLYIEGNRKMYNRITENDIPVMSALLLRHYIYSL